ncbi:hypothetical protein C475_21809 [Halosimplex carlsbadense 2-9-1]|uniref:Uncharacterized protein n=1 Tax=Halosimplex carlsbadense 2-9-1 TaxID=797114 RepID=M0CBH5_9EURY|nr:hypothetical protein [Halosimplex carlsbadense]ELZ19978.1 hypothetical protein C475_21809 [Halosimplex carlsbadense 2-9-1]
MKQGSTDDPFAEEPADARDDPEGDETSRDDALDRTEATESSRDDSGERSGARTADGADGSGSETESPSGAGAQRRSLPYIHARDGVKDGRTQRPVFLRDHVESGIDELVAEMEAELGEDVYKTDVTEAAMAVAQENPELVLGKLEEWGYGWT